MTCAIRRRILTDSGNNLMTLLLLKGWIDG